MNQTQISVNHRQIGYRIKEVREQNHISQAQLAEMTDLSVSYISHIEMQKESKPGICHPYRECPRHYRG